MENTENKKPNQGKRKTLWIAQTASMLALLIVLQFATGFLGNVFITGSVVNLMLIVSVMICGLSSGLTVAIISPFLAKLIGIGPLWEIISFIALGNITIVLIWHFIGNRNIWKKYIAYIIALIVAAVAKFSVLYFSIVKLAIPFFLNLPAPQASIISNMFSVTQLITALIGGTLAIMILPPLKKALGGKRG